MHYEIKLGDNLATLKTYPDNHFDSIVTDPPYFIDFLGKDWDSSKNDFTPLFRECLRVLKPGGYILAFSAARTYHKLAVQIETAGFEIRDQLMWLYSSGFPKAQDIGKAIQKRLGVEETKAYEFNSPRIGGQEPGNEIVGTSTVCTSPEAQQWSGFKTALKPAHEPIVLARKPFKGSTIDNVLKNGLGAMNIDATRVPWADEADSNITIGGYADTFANTNPEAYAEKTGIKKKKSDREIAAAGRAVPIVMNPGGGVLPNMENQPLYETNDGGRYPSNVIGEVAEGYQKYFYCPKVSRRERHTGFDIQSIPDNGNNVVGGMYGENQSITRSKVPAIGNNHPTVKPVALMEYLIKLVTPPSTDKLQRRVLDPFMGSGSTGMAATALGHHFTGCELDPNYVKIADTRIKAWNTPDSGEKTATEDRSTFNDLFDNK